MKQRLTLYDILRVLFKRKGIIIPFVLIVFLATAAKIVFLPTYKASTTIMMTMRWRPTSIEPERLGVREQIAFIHTNISLMRSKPVLLEVIRRLSLCEDETPESLERALGILRDSISVESITFTNLVSIIAESYDPQEAADIANTLVDVFQNWTTEFVQLEVSGVADFVEGEVSRAKNQLRFLEDAMKEFKTREGITVSDGITATKFEDVTPLYEHVARDEAVLDSNRSRLSGIEQDLNVNGFKINGLGIAHTASLIKESDNVKFFKEGLKDIEMKLAYYRRSFTEEHPSMKNVVKQEDAMKDSLYKEMARLAKLEGVSEFTIRSLAEEYFRVYSEIVVLEVSTEAFRSVIQAGEDKKWNVRKDFMPEDEAEYVRLARDLSFGEILYEELNEDKEILDILKSVKDMRFVQIVSPAVVPLKPSGRFSTLIIGNFIGLFLAISLAMGVEYRNHSFKRPRDVDEYLRIPLLEVLPLTRAKEKEDTFRLKQVSVAAERLFKFASTFLSARKGKETRTIQVTSSLPGEGKTFVALNLAVAASQLGYNTLLIDTSFRNPCVHNAFAAKLNDGFIDTLTGGLKPEDAIKKTGFSKLDIITYGELPQRVAHLFNSEQIEKILNSFQGQYDLIVLDTAAVNFFADSVVVAGAVESALLVIQSDITQKESVATAVKILTGKCELLGVVLNNMHYYIPGTVFRMLTNLHIS